MAELITDHLYRVYQSSEKGGLDRQGKCAWLGTCLQPVEAHAGQTESSKRQRLKPKGSEDEC